MSVFQGDPALTITKDGSTMKFIEGQPVMDKGYENAVLISLFTSQGWVGNALALSDNEEIGSDFEESNKEPINLEGLNKRRDAAKRSMQWAVTEGIFSNVEVTVTNPSGNIIVVTILITPPTGPSLTLILENQGANWKFQKEEPAHRRL